MNEPNPTHHTPRFFCPSLIDVQSSQVSDSLCKLDKPESHHALHVLRLSVGDPLVLFDGKGALATATLHATEAKRIICRLNDLTHQPKPKPTLTVASAVPKGPRADAMIDQLSQLGVDRFIPLKCEHSVAIPKKNKIEKFARAAIESAKQCGRTWLMQIEEPAFPNEVWQDQRYDLKLLAAPAAGVVPDLQNQLKNASEVLTLIGPEGGWSDEELDAATRAGCHPWRIAPYVLRIETAAVAAAAILRYPNAI